MKHARLPTKPISFRLPAGMKKQLEELVAKGEARSVSHAVFEALRDFLAKQRKGAK